MNGLPEFICFAGFKLHRIVADGAEQVVRHLSVSLLTKSSSGRLYPGDEGHWFSLSYFRDSFTSAVGLPKGQWVGFHRDMGRQMRVFAQALSSLFLQITAACHTLPNVRTLPTLAEKAACRRLFRQLGRRRLDASIQRSADSICSDHSPESQGTSPRRVLDSNESLYTSLRCAHFWASVSCAI